MSKEGKKEQLRRKGEIRKKGKKDLKKKGGRNENIGKVVREQTVDVNAFRVSALFPRLDFSVCNTIQ